LKVPVGTQVLDEDKVTEIADIIEEGVPVLLAEGGLGGLGNSHFKTSINRAPRRTTFGTPGEEKQIWLKLKLIADVGLVGMPNAGKSAFIRQVTNVPAKTGDYPFTTLKPQLGVVRLDDEREFVIADIPGLIKDAHSGKGLGDKFLAHVERCSILIHIIDANCENPIQNYEAIRKEMELYNKAMIEKPEIIALNKIDLLPEDKLSDIVELFQKLVSKQVLAMSALTGIGCSDVVAAIDSLSTDPQFYESNRAPS
jgi:GTP-binding protein